MTELYWFICYTCEEDDVFSDRESAQLRFSEHAKQQHEVVLKRVEAPVEPPDQKSKDDAPLSESAEQDSETGDSQSAGR